MKYFRHDLHMGDVMEITKDHARWALEGCYKDDFLRDVFRNDRMFQLKTPYAIYYTMDEQGRVPMAGFYGTVG